MPINKLKGQDIQVVCVVDDKAEDRIGPWLDMDVTLRKEVLEGEYLGETTTYFDSVFRGCQITLKGHLRGAMWLKIIDRDIKRARYQTGGIIRFDIVAVMKFPGLVHPYTFRDCTFADHKLTISDRKSFVEASLDCMCSENPAAPNL